MNTYEELPKGYTHDQIIAKVQWFNDYMQLYIHEIESDMNNKIICDTEEEKHIFSLKKSMLEQMIEQYSEIFHEIIEWRKL